MSVEPMLRAPNIDDFGSWASSLCALHCLLTALAPALFTILGLEMLLGHEAEWGLTFVAALFAIGAMILAWRRQPGISGVVVLFSAGIVGLMMGRVLEESGFHSTGTATSIVASLALVCGHISNIRACRCCDEEQC